VSQSLQARLDAPTGGSGRADRIPAILERVDLVAEVERRAGPGRRDGSARLKWCCPLPGHDESTPSFTVFAAARPANFTCFGCKRGGDVIHFTQYMDELSRADAIHRLAERLDDAQPAPPRAPAPTAAIDGLDAWLAECHDALLSHRAAGRARAYLRSRGMDGDGVRRYRLGYGLPAPGKLGALRGRVVFPCAPYGAEGRAVDSRQPKYLTVGDKRAWGLSEACAVDGPLLLCEGPLDRIGFQQLVDNVAALRGKSVKREDAELIRALGFAHVFVCLDGDAAASDGAGIVRTLADAGVAARFVRGFTSGDAGDLIGAADALTTMSEALVTP
jgi:DNA primase